jgi:arabinoxylan arabinofuranohydrolase
MSAFAGQESRKLYHTRKATRYPSRGPSHKHTKKPSQSPKVHHSPTHLITAAPSRKTNSPSSSAPSSLKPTTSIPTYSPSAAPTVSPSNAPLPRVLSLLTSAESGFLYIADPNALVVNEVIYVFCSVDPPNAGPDTKYNNMRSYALVSSTDPLYQWENHGIVLSPSTDFPQVPDFSAKLMFAPGALYSEGWFYFYFPYLRTATSENNVGIARSRTPWKRGTWTLLIESFIAPDVFDPCAAFSVNGVPYLYGTTHNPADLEIDHTMIGTQLDGDFTSWSEGTTEMTTLSNAPVTEALFVFWRNDSTNAVTYYFFARQQLGKNDALFYWTSNTPFPTGDDLTYQGRMTPNQFDAPPHGSVVEYKGVFYLFYNSGLINNGNRWRRSTCVDVVTFNEQNLIDEVQLSCPILAKP